MCSRAFPYIFLALSAYLPYNDGSEHLFDYHMIKTLSKQEDPREFAQTIMPLSVHLQP